MRMGKASAESAGRGAWLLESPSAPFVVSCTADGRSIYTVQAEAGPSQFNVPSERGKAVWDSSVVLLHTMTRL